MWRWIVFGLLSALSSAASIILVKFSLKDADPTLIATIRTVIAGGFLVVVSLLFKKFTLNGPILPTINGLLVVLSGICTGLSWIFFIVALKYGSASKVVALDRTSLVFTLILCAFTLCETITRQSIVGALFILFGAYLIGTV